MKRTILILLACIPAISGFAGQADTLKVYSQSMKKSIPVVVIIPDTYTAEKTYPVVYLLHGYGGNFTQWVNHAPQIIEEADRYDIMIVCPDGGYSSWYLDSPSDTTSKYETFVSRELVAYIDAHYSTRRQREFRAISGLSMGGHGALYLSVRNKEIYSAAGSIAGGVDVRPFPTRWDMLRVFGDTLCCWDNWNRHTVINVIKDLKPGELSLIIDCGYDDFFLEVNRNLHKQLLEDGIPHDYTERPGAHNKEYWGNSISYHLLYFSKFFRKNEVKIDKSNP